MKNELLLMASVPLIYGSVLLAYRLFGRGGLYAMTAIATLLANIEVLLLVDAFGLEQTLGNVLFASTYLITDILSENEGQKASARAVWVGVFTSAVMLVFTQFWLLYNPAASDWAGEPIRAIFSTTPRLMLASFLGYVVSQRFDVWLYHRLWALTAKRSGSTTRFLWLRNNVATWISQIINTVLFNVIAFWGWYEPKTVLSVMVSGYIVYIFTGLLDTPFVYAARRMKRRGVVPAEPNEATVCGSSGARGASDERT